ncbi:MAG: hypothetical protein ACXWQE_06100 [Bdellovibrionales bacterium]
MSTQAEFTTRLSARAVTAGTVSVFASMILLMLIAAGFELWKFDVDEIQGLGVGFWFWSFAAWAISNYVGAYTAAMASHSRESRDGMLHGFVVWASASVLGMIFIGVVSGSIFQGVLLPIPSNFMLWGAVVCDLIAMALAFRGGVSGSIKELKAWAPEERAPDHESQRAEPAFGHSN